LFKAVITDKLPKGGKPVGTGRIGVVTNKILGQFLFFMGRVSKVDNQVIFLLIGYCKFFRESTPLLLSKIKVYYTSEVETIQVLVKKTTEPSPLLTGS
jgi:hypothetical protein